MAKKRQDDPPPLEEKNFRSPEEIESAISKIQRRITEVEHLDIQSDVMHDTGAVGVAESNISSMIREVFGPNSPEFHEHGNIPIWAGPMYIGMNDHEFLASKMRGRTKVIGILNGLIGRLNEKKADMTAGALPAPSTYFDRLALHSRIADVARDLFMDGYAWEAVFAASKALVNYVKDRSGRHDLDGAPLVRTVFSRANPILAFNALVDQTDQDEQEGMMHLFEGAVLGIRNPGGHSFPEGSDQRAMEYISLLSLLAYRVQEATRKK